MSSAFAAGFGLGFLVAAQVGPIWLLCARSVLRGTAQVGIAIGAGAAVIDALYAALGALGASALLEIDALRVALGAVGVAFLAFLGVRTLWSAFRVRLGGEAPEEVATPRRAFLTSLAATASNPLTIASWAAVFTAASTADLVSSASGAAALVLGVGVGTLTWFTALSLTLSVARRRAGERLLVAVDVISGLALLAFAALLGYRTAVS
ncbi:MAG TPA: LysE family transporter [Gaiellaceae bacterium]|nr:LysE family transporter [Gaiellaceae bacterium]